MGQIFSQLTQPNSALVNPNGTVAAMGDPSQIRDADFRMNSQQHPYLPGTPNPNPPTPTAQTPTFAQAASYGATPGGANALSPGLTKAGKLVTLLTSGLQGALAGRAKSEETVAATGGRRSGGAGMGFESGYTLPWQRTGQQLGLEQQEANVEATRAQNATVNTPQGPMPAWLARYTAPASIRAGATEQAATTRAGAQTQSAQTRAEASKDVARINQGQAIPVDQTTAELAGFPELAGQQAGRGTWTNINKALEARGYRVQDMGQNGSGENEGMWLMDRAGARVKQISPNSLTFQRGASFAQNRPEVVVDPNDPGYAYYTTAAKAMQGNLPAPQGAAPQAAKREAVSEVPTKVGDLKVAFNTATQHADLLANAMKALTNGDQQTLSRIKNSFTNEFGSPGPITAQAIADAYTREVTKMLSSGHLTDSEVATIGKTLDPQRQSPQQIAGVLSAYKALAQSKLNVLNQQANASKHQGRSKTQKNDPLAIRP